MLNLDRNGSVDCRKPASSLLKVTIFKKFWSLLAACLMLQSALPLGSVGKSLLFTLLLYRLKLVWNRPKAGYTLFWHSSTLPCVAAHWRAGLVFLCTQTHICEWISEVSRVCVKTYKIKHFINTDLGMFKMIKQSESVIGKKCMVTSPDCPVVAARGNNACSSLHSGYNNEVGV